MAIGTELKYAKLDELYFDPLNSRLGRNNTGRDVTQQQLLELMRDWTLDELVVSFLDSGGFWTHEPLLVTEETLYGKKHLIVIEGNRRLAALKFLKKAIDGGKAPKKLIDIAKGAKIPSELFTKIPYVQVGSRQEIESFLGFRHVTGIKEWKPAEKAEFIAKLIDERGMTYDEVRRKIGSNTEAVRRNYISYRLLLQIEETTDISEEQFKDRFSVMYLSLRTQGVQKYLQIDIYADPKSAKKPVPKSRLKELVNFSLWLFGKDEKQRPLFSDSRQVDNFGRILENKEAVEYLIRAEQPSFDVALRTAGGDEPEIIMLIEKAADEVELALTRIHFFKKSKKIQDAVKRFGTDAEQLLKIFPDIRKQLDKETK
jgi:hypothetical protein